MSDPRIVLAEFRGYYKQAFPVTLTDGSEGMSDFKVWHTPDHRRMRPTEQLPDPANNAADCESLIRKLNEEDYVVDIIHRPSNTWVRIYRSGDVSEAKICDDWKAGVVELAMKIVTDEKNDD